MSQIRIQSQVAETMAARMRLLAAEIMREYTALRTAVLRGSDTTEQGAAFLARLDSYEMMICGDTRAGLRLAADAFADRPVAERVAMVQQDLDEFA